MNITCEYCQDVGCEMCCAPVIPEQMPFVTTYPPHRDCYEDVSTLLDRPTWSPEQNESSIWD